MDGQLATVYLDEQTGQLLHVRLVVLRLEHRELHDSINELYLSRSSDQLKLKRMNRHKLVVKDAIAKLESILIPDLDALRLFSLGMPL